jgi:uncharacterized Fe-S cluster-containing protein
MIPKDKVLKKKLKLLKTQKQIQKELYFELVHEYIELQEIFEVEDYLDKSMLLIDMILYPIYLIYKIIIMDFSPLDILTIIKTHELWIDYLRYRELKFKIEEWKSIVQLVSGPWISTNNPKYHDLVYADAMTRIYNIQLLGLTKKLTKSTK